MFAGKLIESSTSTEHARPHVKVSAMLCHFITLQLTLVNITIYEEQPFPSVVLFAKLYYNFPHEKKHIVTAALVTS